MRLLRHSDDEHEETTAEGMGSGEPEEVTSDPENAAAAEAIRASTLVGPEKGS